MRSRLAAAAVVAIPAALIVACSAGAGEKAAAAPADRRQAIDKTLRRLEGASTKFEARAYRDGKGALLPYRLFRPPAVPGTKYPMIVFLHGSNGAGADNLRQISGANLLGSSLWILPENQRRHPAFVLVPQAMEDWEETDLSGYLFLVSMAIESLEAEMDVDPSRVYLTGQSSGGYGAWNLIAHRPDLFAAAVPLCGGGDPTKAAAMIGIPIWAFVGTADDVVAPDESRRMIAAVKRAGGRPKLTEYPGVGHDVWLQAYTEPGLLDWIFSQSRTGARHDP
jgi:predicted peptidase